MPHWLIVAANAGPLARACVDAGHGCDLIEPFGDVDTCALADRHVRVDVGMYGFTTRVVEAAASLRGDWDGIVLGSGFEARPGLIDDMARLGTVFGNDAATVRRCKDPVVLAAVARDSALPMAEPRTCGALDRSWLVKPIGACGGLGIRQADDGEHMAPGWYGQRFVRGMPASVLFLADGARVRIVGLSEQRPGGKAGPFAWREAISHAPVAAEVEAGIAQALAMLVARLGLRGLNGADLVFDGATPILLEINPRPTATMALYDHEVDGGLFAAHIAACTGRLDPVPPSRRCGRRGLRVVYAERETDIPAAAGWPTGTTDLPAAGSRIAAGAPICTVYAAGEDNESIRAGLDRHERAVLYMSASSNERGQTTTTVFT
ncbi:ATP-grasp domain-containing protein [Methyloversatilis thermotolerans]|uniref:ATP-grasp domain-containing protein n=1 Tax=Methyloversatilis thermotolerans TaxID=1346290 RepID=UPI00036E0F78|nr:ATP-grasp domain-containing protein [Methyloversatilis thermotolerans]